VSLLQITSTCDGGSLLETHMDKERFLELNDDQVEEVVAAYHRPGHVPPPSCTMTLAWPPEEPVCEPPLP
jgi:hypothetical protein